MKQIHYRTKDGAIESADDIYSNVATITSEDGHTDKYWRMNKGNVEFNIAPSVASFRYQLDSFFKTGSCACCFFSLCKMEIAWISDRIREGLDSLNSLKDKPSEASVALLRAFDIASQTNPYLSPSLGHLPKMIDIDNYSDDKNVTSLYKVKIKGLGKKPITIDDPKAWTISVSSNEKPNLSLAYWRDEMLHPCYIPAKSVEGILELNEIDFAEFDAYGVSPLEYAYIVLLLEVLAKISEFANSSD